MKISPVQLKQLMFKRVHVALDERHMPVHGGAPWSHVALFEGVNIATGFGIDTLAIDAEPGLHYMVSLQVQVDNVAVLEANDQRFAPYLLDLEAAGVVTVPPGAEKLAPPEDLAAVNGAALLWSAIREQVLALTSRMPAGPAMLPTVHFHDLKRQPQAAPAPAASEAAAAPAVAVATARKRVRGVRAATKPA